MTSYRRKGCFDSLPTPVLGGRSREKGGGNRVAGGFIDDLMSLDARV